MENKLVRIKQLIELKEQTDAELETLIGGGSYVSFGNNRTSGNTTSDGSPTTVVSQF